MSDENVTKPSGQNPLQAFAGAFGNAVGGAVSAVADTIGTTVGGGVQAAGKAVHALESMVPGAGAGVTAEQYIEQSEPVHHEGAAAKPVSEGSKPVSEDSKPVSEDAKQSESQTLNNLDESSGLKADKTGVVLNRGQDLSAPVSDGQTSKPKIESEPVAEAGGLKDIEVVSGHAVPKDLASRLAHPDQEAESSAASGRPVASVTSEPMSFDDANNSPSKENKAAPEDVSTKDESATFVEGVPHISAPDVEAANKDNVHAEGNVATGVKEEAIALGEGAAGGIKSAVEAVAGSIGNTVGAGVSAVSNAAERVGVVAEDAVKQADDDHQTHEPVDDKADVKAPRNADVGNKQVSAADKGKGKGIENLSAADQIIASSEPLKDKNDTKHARQVEAKVAKQQAEFESSSSPADELKEAPKDGPAAQLDNPKQDENTPASERPSEDFNPADVPNTQEEALEAQAAEEGKTVILTAENIPPAVLTADGELPTVPDTDKDLLQQALDRSAEKGKDFHDPIADLPLHPEPAPSLHLPGENDDAANPTALPEQLDRNATEAAKHAPKYAGDTGDSHKPSFAELAKKHRPEELDETPEKLVAEGKVGAAEIGLYDGQDIDIPGAQGPIPKGTPPVEVQGFRASDQAAQNEVYGGSKIGANQTCGTAPGLSNQYPDDPSAYLTQAAGKDVKKSSK